MAEGKPAPQADARPAVRQDNQTPELFGQTPWQTVGPYFHFQLPWKGCADLLGTSTLGARLDLMPADHCLLYSTSAHAAVEGTAISVTGAVLDGRGEAVPDALLEFWQADAAGRYHSADDRRVSPPASPQFMGFARCATAADGSYQLRTILPGPVPGPRGLPQAPHIAVGVLGRGLLKRLVTRIYFEGQSANAGDFVLAQVPAARRDTLIARRAEARPDGLESYHFDIRLHGGQETVFFDC